MSDTEKLTPQPAANTKQAAKQIHAKGLVCKTATSFSHENQKFCTSSGNNFLFCYRVVTNKSYTLNITLEKDFLFAVFAPEGKAAVVAKPLRLSKTSGLQPVFGKQQTEGEFYFFSAISLGKFLEKDLLGGVRK